MAFLRSIIGTQEQNCIVWPMGRDLQGYGIIGINRKICRASRVMCEMVHGAPPTPTHHAAHKCGLGHTGCVNPNHLEWKTPSENQMDRHLHGTLPQKGRTKQKLTDAQVAEIRSLAGKVTQRELARRYGVRWETIGQIQRRKYRNGPPRPAVRIPVEKRETFAVQAASLRSQGKTYYEIGDTLGVSRGTAKKFAEGKF